RTHRPHVALPRPQRLAPLRPGRLAGRLGSHGAVDARQGDRRDRRRQLRGRGTALGAPAVPQSVSHLRDPEHGADARRDLLSRRAGRRLRSGRSLRVLAGRAAAAGHPRRRHADQPVRDQVTQARPVLIREIAANHYLIPLPVALSDSTHGTIKGFELITARVRDAEGVEGTGYTCTVGAGGAAGRALVARDLAPLLTGPHADLIQRPRQGAWGGAP